MTINLIEKGSTSRFFHPGQHENSPSKYKPQLAYSDTIKLIKAIPEGEWQSPNEVNLGRIFDHKQEDTDKILSPWVEFLDDAGTGKELIEDTAKQGLFHVLPHALNKGIIFMKVAEKMGFNWENSPELLESCKRGFLALLSSEAREELESTEAFAVSEEDIKNTKEFVEIMNNSFNALEFKEKFAR